MLLLSGIKGQSNAVRYLSSSLSSGRTASSYLFYGPRGVGRASCARAFAAEIFCLERTRDGACGMCPACRKVESELHPDLMWIRPEKNKAIKIEQIRKAREKLSLKPFESPAGFCVIEDAHMMTQEASNALLKVLEEPPGDSILALITDKKELLLQTVVSRCSEVRFRPLPAADTVEIIKARADGISEDDASFLASFSQGSPGAALAMMEEGLLLRREQLASLVSEAMREENPSCLNWDTADRNLLIEDLDMLIVFIRDAALGGAGMEEMALDKRIAATDMYRRLSGYTPGGLYRLAGRLIGMKAALAGNVNPKIAAQALPGLFDI